jgi:hypothetical protein
MRKRIKPAQRVFSSMIPVIVGFTGELINIDFKPIKLPSLAVLKEPQIMDVNGEQIVIAAIGETPKSLSFIFADRYITLSELNAGQQHSTITFDNTVVRFDELLHKDLPKLSNKTFQCTACTQVRVPSQCRDMIINKLVVAYTFEEIKLS